MLGISSIQPPVSHTGPFLNSRSREQIELLGIEIKDLKQADTGRFELKTKFINQHFINELDKMGLQFINIRGTWLGRLIVVLEQRNLNSTSA